MVAGFTPTSIDEALELLLENELIPYAGGTDLMIKGDTDASYLFLHKISELKKITQDEQYYYFGAGCTFTELLENEITPAILKETVAQIAAPAIRNEATIGGNIGNGSAKADSALIFSVTDSILKICGSKGERLVSINEFYLGNKKIDLMSDELIVEILMPKKWINDYYYQKVGARKALAISRVSFAGLMSIQDGVIEHCATAFGAVSDRIIRCSEIDAMLIGKTLEEVSEKNESIAIKEQYLAEIDAAIIPIKGRVSAEYRKSVCMNLVRDFLGGFEI